MNNWTIKRRITFGFATVLILVALLTGISAWELHLAKKEATFMATDAMPGSAAMADIMASCEQLQIKTLSVVLARNDADRQTLFKELEVIVKDHGKDLDDYEATIHLAEDRAMFGDLQSARVRYEEARNRVFDLCRNGKIEEAQAGLNTTIVPAYTAYEAQVDKMRKWNFDNAFASGDRTSACVNRTASVNLWLSLAILLVATLLAGVISLSLNRILQRVAAAINEGAGNVSVAASQVASTSQSLAEGSSEQAASVEEISASLEETGSMIKRNDDFATRANTLARQARGAAERGVADMAAMSSAMDSIKSSSDDVAKILRTIDEIAFQTNILALNAAVEAARAGEAGMGFAVVADEVRNLAQRSATAAKETANRIESALVSSRTGVDLSQKVAAVLDEIAVKVREVDELAHEVASSSKEQSTGVTQINTAVGQLDKVTQSTAANAEESAAAAEELNSQAETMKLHVEDLVLLVGGQPSTPVRSRTQALRPAAGATVKKTAPVSPAPLKPANPRDSIPLEAGFRDF